MRRLANLTLDNLAELPSPCRECVFWELDPAAAERAAAGDTALEKEAWVSATLLEWGTCGYLCSVDDKPAGHVLFAPPAYVPRAASFPTSPVGADALLLMTVHVRPEFAGTGIGRTLVQAVARDAVRGGIRAIEAFGHAGAAERPEQTGRARTDPSARCVLPADFLLAVGFKTVRPHPRTPRLRLDIRSTVTWRADAEAALERIFTAFPAAVPAR